MALVNFSDILSTEALVWNNFILGLVVAAYNLYYLFAKRNVDVHS